MADHILEMKSITKSFPGVTALDNVSFSVTRGTIHALVGENGAGKSTLMKILNGVYQADKGEIFFNGELVRLRDTIEAKSLGIGLIFQEFNHINTLSAAENIFLNRLQKKNGRIAWKQIQKEAQLLIDRLGFGFDVNETISDLSAAQKQLVEIAKVLSVDAKLIVMDEPTSSLSTSETKKLFDIIAKLKAEGVTIIYISHKLEEVLGISDMITVLRDGCVIDTRPTGDFTRDEIVERMVGRVVEMEYPRKNCELGDVILSASNIVRKGILHGISFDIRAGEILGIAGLVGSGRTELAEAIFGAEKYEGTISVKGKMVRVRSTYDGKKNGIGLLTEDRKETGLVLNYDLVRNISITNLKKVKKGAFLSRKLEADLTGQSAKNLDVKTPSMKQLAVNLSGGNQQKVVFAKWLFSDADVLILDEPTRGIDVGAKYEVYLLMNSLAEQGKAIIMISSELPEVLGMSDRVIVLSDGSKVGELDRAEATAEAVMRMAIGS